MRPTIDTGRLVASHQESTRSDRRIVLAMVCFSVAVMAGLAGWLSTMAPPSAAPLDAAAMGGDE